MADDFAPAAPADAAASFRHEAGFQQALEGGPGLGAQQSGRPDREAFRSAYPEQHATGADQHQGQHAHATGALSAPTTVDGYSFPEGWADGAPALAEEMGAWGVNARITVGNHVRDRARDRPATERGARPSDAIVEAQARNMEANLQATAEGRAMLQRAQARWRALERTRRTLLGLCMPLARQSTSRSSGHSADDRAVTGSHDSGGGGGGSSRRSYPHVHEVHLELSPPDPTVFLAFPAALHG